MYSTPEKEANCAIFVHKTGGWYCQWQIQKCVGGAFPGHLITVTWDASVKQLRDTDENTYLTCMGQVVDSEMWY